MAVRAQSWKPVLAAGAAALAVAFLGATVTDLGPWYQNLNKPSWQPPDWLFGPAWTLIFACAALSGVTAWRDAPERADREWILGLFALNGALNIGWSLLFFRLQKPGWALVEVVFLWLSIALLIVVLGRYSRPAAWFLVPYAVWVAFAAALNLAIVLLNPAA